MGRLRQRRTHRSIRPRGTPLSVERGAGRTAIGRLSSTDVSDAAAAIVPRANRPFGLPFPMDRTFLLLGSIAAFVGVALGAFGAHGLRARLSTEMLAVFETGVRYQMYHAFAILVVAVVAARFDGWLVRAAGWLFAAGIVLFSGSLYALALSGATRLGAVTPIGGLAFLAGWALLAFTALALAGAPLRPL
jgi:uncharacterized membrane protein YgdD (TMEM256/DUF423 family)